MRITTTEELMTALENKTPLELGENGSLHKQSWFGQIVSWFRDKILPHAARAMYTMHLRIAMAQLISDEAVAVQGPQNLEDPLPLRGHYDALGSKRILESSIIKHVVEKELAGQPHEVIRGVQKYIAGKWEREDGKNCDISTLDFDMLKEFTLDMLGEIQQPGTGTPAILAYGYSLGKEDLKQHMAYIEHSVQKAVQETWEPGHKDSFTPKGVYVAFSNDAKRDRPIIQGKQHTTRDCPDPKDACDKYNQLLTSELQEPSMVAVSGICMSQTILMEFTKMLWGMDPTCPPLLKFMSPGDSLTQGLVLASIDNMEATDGEDPRVVMEHTPQEIKVKIRLGISASESTSPFKKCIGKLVTELSIPKGQFPLQQGQKPKISVTNMNFEKQTAFN